MNRKDKDKIRTILEIERESKYHFNLIVPIAFVLSAILLFIKDVVDKQLQFRSLYVVGLLNLIAFIYSIKEFNCKRKLLKKLKMEVGLE